MDKLTFPIEGLVYSLDRAPTKHGRRAVATVRLADAPDDRGLTDRVDLFVFRSRQRFAQLVAETYGRETKEILGHLGHVLAEIEREQAKPARNARNAPVQLTLDWEGQGPKERETTPAPGQLKLEQRASSEPGRDLLCELRLEKVKEDPEAAEAALDALGEFLVSVWLRCKKLEQRRVAA